MVKGLVTTVAAAAALLAATATAQAEDRAVVITQQNYAKYGRAPVGNSNALIDALRSSGLRVVSGADLTNQQMREAIMDLARPDPSPGARIVVLTGQFVSSESDSWLVGTDATVSDLAHADFVGMPLSMVGDLMRDGGERSVLLIADTAGSVRPGAGLRDGVRGIGVREPLNVLAGTPAGIATAATRLLAPGTSISTALKMNGAPNLVQGPGAASVPFPRKADPLTDGGRVLEGEAEAWVQTAAAHSIGAYEEFLRRFPGGRYADVARTRVNQMRGSGDYSAQLGEVQLNLSRGERAQIQRQLTLLTYDTRGIDGIFGTDTRAALARWQRDNGLAATGYLNTAAVARLKQQTTERTNRLETEARARQSADAARDDAYWEDVASVGGVPGIRSYLEKYPEGRHAAEARAALGASDGQTQQNAAWKGALKANTVAAYQDIIGKYPGTAIAREAQTRINALNAARADRDAEAKLGLSQLTRQLIEARLSASGLDAGAADGTFDAKTRAAIRAYQQSRNLRPTGYMNDGTMVRLLADTVIGF